MPIVAPLHRLNTTPSEFRGTEDKLVRTRKQKERLSEIEDEELQDRVWDMWVAYVLDIKRRVQSGETIDPEEKTFDWWWWNKIRASDGYLPKTPQ